MCRGHADRKSKIPNKNAFFHNYCKNEINPQTSNIYTHETVTNEEICKMLSIK